MNSPYPPQGSTPLNRMKRRIDTEQLKMPLGFLRIIELVFALIVLAAMSGWEFDMKYFCTVNNQNKTDELSNQTFSHFEDIPVAQINKCNKFVNSTDKNVTAPVQPFKDLSIGIGPGLYSYLVSATIIFSVGTLMLYVFNYALYVSDNRLPTLDLAVTVVIAFGWLFGTFLFSLAVGRIEDATKEETVSDLFKTNSTLNLCEGIGDKCMSGVVSYAAYATLNVAVLAGCALVLLFFTNIWFCYKETGAFRVRQSHNQMLHQMQQEPYTLE